MHFIIPTRRSSSDEENKLMRSRKENEEEMHAQIFNRNNVLVIVTLNQILHNVESTSLRWTDGVFVCIQDPANYSLTKWFYNLHNC